VLFFFVIFIFYRLIVLYKYAIDSNVYKG